jgi:branched-subunit amino acid ABC-type transport system permease component
VGELAQLIVNGLVTGSIIALGAVGVSLIYGILRIINFAHGDYLMVGAYLALLANVTLHAGMVVATLVAVAGTLAVSVLLELACWRPLRRKGAGTFSLFIVAIGLALILRNLILLVAGAEPSRYDVDVFQAYALGPIRLAQSQLISIALAAVVLLAVGAALSRSTVGKALRALADNGPLAAVAGIDVDRMVVITWAIAGALAGLAGVLLGLVQVSFDPNAGFLLLLPIFAAVILGGIGSAYGALVGGLALGLAMEVSTWSGFAGGVSPVYKPVVAFALLAVVLLVRPRGLFGRELRAA